MKPLARKLTLIGLGLLSAQAALPQAAPPDGWKLAPFSSPDKLLASQGRPLRLNAWQPIPVEIDAVRGETVSFQFVVTAGEEPIKTLSVQPNGLASIKSDFIDSKQFSFFREKYVAVAKPSGNRIRTPKWWPDALVSLELASQTIEPHSSAVYWATLRIPRDAAPDDYYGELDLSANGENRRLSLTLRVRPLQLPPIRFRGTVALYYDTLRDWYRKDGREFSDAEWTLQKRRYANYLLDFGLNPYDPPVAWDDSSLDDYLKDPRVHSVRTPSLDSPNFSLAVEAFKRTKTQSKAFYYWIDEPQTKEQFAQIKTTTKKLRELGIPHLVTAHPNAELAGAVDIWCPNIGDALGAGHLDNALLRREQAANHPTWLYTMVVPRHPYPTWLLDDDSSAIQSYAPLWAKLGATGFVYSMVHGWGPKPLDDLTSYAGTSGDGTLLYPAELVGGTGPMPSIRLMLLRDALEDFSLWNEATRKKIAPPFSFPANRSGALAYDRKPLLDALESGTPAKAPVATATPQLFADAPLATTFSSPKTWRLDARREVEAQLSGGVLRVEFRGAPLSETDSASVFLAPTNVATKTEQWRLNFSRKDGLKIERRTRAGRFEGDVAGVRATATPSGARFWIPLDALELDSKAVRFNAVARTQSGTARLFIDANDPFLLPLLKESQVKAGQPKAPRASRHTPKTP